MLDGILLSIDNPEACYPVTGGMIMFAAIQQRHPDAIRVNSRPEWFDKLFGSEKVRKAFHGTALSALFQQWIDEQDEYLADKVDLYS